LYVQSFKDGTSHNRIAVSGHPQTELSRFSMSTTVSIHLSRELDAGLRQPAVEPGVLDEFLAQHGLVPQALFPNTRQVAPERIWQIACEDGKAAGIVDKLLAIPGVEAAYMKPQDELPDLP
jgi:hypothetical protein